VSPESTVHPLVAGIVEDAEHRMTHPRLPRRPGEILELLRRLPPQLQPLDIGGVGVGELLAAGLDGEIPLGMGDLRLPRIAILGDQVLPRQRRFAQIRYEPEAPASEFPETTLDSLAGAS